MSLHLPRPVKAALLGFWDLFTSASPLLFAGAGLIWLAYWWLNPMPPKQLTLLTGPEQSAYAEMGDQYAKLLRQHGITVRLVPTEGSADNLRRLQAGEADAGFVQGGSATAPTDDDTEELLTLGNLFVEPVWLFYRAQSAADISETGRLQSLNQLSTLRINAGTAGSGVPPLMDTLLDMHRMDPKKIKISHLEQTPATVQMLQGKLDAVVFASAPQAPMVQMLLQTPGIRLMDFPQNEAYARRLPFITPVTLPRGVVDLARNIPAQDVHLIATTTSMLVRESLHPGLRQLLSQATVQTHGQSGWFQRTREFPNASNSEFPLAPEAERTLKNGIPSLQRYIPFTLANLVERMWLALGIIIAVLLPLGKIAPPLYAYRVRSRVFRWYGELRDIESRLEAHPEDKEKLLEELNAIEAKVEKVILPLSYADELYALRNNIGLVRQRLTTA
ncbi:TAXI family TRAP transporter solute-binding subunit [Rhodoferax sp. TBRC 17660]|uniref:TAXI family TRAP transporter solute-binding subunit n=1 Tax=Rhodoferax potami TaxID=3068338 RepID=A0ABU3KJL3_9BURK|nr:TAXI family TRAP transporter solute-binding subunit [Rhodoferax sp. TBRC 17660]MDT7517932.1 TAXI family TRAP transporter solute-binding subunit [Rhodoferax sp. TBRC 17660]